MSNNSRNNPELIKCDKKSCVYNENGECKDQQSW